MKPNQINHKLLIVLFLFLLKFTDGQTQGNDSILYSDELKQAYLTIVNLAPEDPDSAYMLAIELLEGGSFSDYPRRGLGYFGLAEAYFYRGSFDSARIAYSDALVAYKEIGDSARLAASYNNIGLIYSYVPDYRKALDAYEASLALEELLNNTMGIAQCHQNIGVVYVNWGLYARAEEHYAKALSLFEALNDSSAIADLANNMGIIQVELNNYDAALSFYKKSYLAFKKINNESGLASVTCNLALLFKYQAQYDRSLHYLYEAIDLFKGLNDRRGLTYAYSSLGNVFHLMGDESKALEYYLFVEKENENMGIRNLQKDNLYSIYEVYSAMGNYQKANEALVEYHTLKDSIFSEEKFSKLVEMEKKYHSEKSQNEILALKAKDEKRQLVMWALFVVFVMATVIIYVVYKIQRIKERQRRLLLEQKILLTQMNPHFMFNSLSALQCLIMEEQTADAVDFVAEFAGLMRLVLQYSKEEMISLKKEEEILDYYMSLQNRRFSHKIAYKIEMDPALQIDKVLVPPMLAQPFVENAIEHGELSEYADSTIRVSFRREADNLECVIEDNGIGVLNARSKNKRSNHKSMAIDITRERIRLLYQSSSIKAFDLLVEDLSEHGRNGTRVKFNIPYQELN